MNPKLSLYEDQMDFFCYHLRKKLETHHDNGIFRIPVSFGVPGEFMWDAARRNKDLLAAHFGSDVQIGVSKTTRYQVYESICCPDRLDRTHHIQAYDFIAGLGLQSYDGTVSSGPKRLMTRPLQRHDVWHHEEEHLSVTLFRLK